MFENILTAGTLIKFFTDLDADQVSANFDGFDERKLPTRSTSRNLKAFFAMRAAGGQ